MLAEEDTVSSWLSQEPELRLLLKGRGEDTCLHFEDPL